MNLLNNETLTDTEIIKQIKPVLARHAPERHELIAILQETQDTFRYLPAAAIREISRFLNISESSVYGVCTFYARFKLKPLGKKIIQVCRGTACHVRGAGKVLAELEKRLGVKAGETTPDLEYTLETVACIGACALAPTILVDGEVHGKMTPGHVAEVLGGKK